MTSGLHGKIVQVMDDGVIIETMAGKQKFEKAAISREYTDMRFGEKAKKDAPAKDAKPAKEVKEENVTVTDETAK